MRAAGSFSGLPRVRVSFPGSTPGIKLAPRPWAVVLLLCGMLLLGGYGHIAGRLRFRQLLEGSSSNSSSRGANRTSNASTGSSAWSKAAAAGGAAGTTAAVVAAARGNGGGGGSSGSSSSMGVSALSVYRDLANTSDALTRTALVHGRVRKSGIADPRAWLGDHSDERLDSFLSWRLNRSRSGGPGPASADSYSCSAAADHPPLPFPGCHVFINHQYRYIYIRSPKAASTSIVNALGECNNTRTRGHNSSSCMALHFYWPRAALQPQALAETWRDYFVFGFVRNPWRRAYSLYKYIHSNGCMDDASLKDPGCRMPWPTFCADPWAGVEALHERGCIKRSRSYLYFHMADQYHCLRGADGGWGVDFIGRVDEPNEDWGQVVRTLNANRLPGVPELPVTELEQQNARRGGEKDPYGGGDGSSSSGAAAAHSGQGGQQCFNAVSRWYACDVERFGFAGAGREQQAQTPSQPQQQQQQPKQQQQQPQKQQQQQPQQQRPAVVQHT